ncbi:MULTISPECIES: hypothetical protein [unclassified Polynucleobacter]|jgi:hypothetical protein|uniref:hypothetical protein n=1 Tax=unclassified Polynucleobacter TaxID=2640945 RepID=UPI000BD572F1|nr:MULTISPECIES: hypothetical protein [unclassified Polynucleobacter]OYY18683.1 MAG: hypothetical protein B7Y67_06620 [Polynucleobacter sp. 35-46-11]OZA76737.1 MAG: hypothetical protein B7X71_07370 [Polynucleobacter sp. 39-46-10]
MPSKPNKNLLQTLAAIAELESGKGQKFNTVEELMADLHCKELEDQQDLKMADKSMKELRSGKAKAIPIERLIRSIDRKIAIKEALSS